MIKEIVGTCMLTATIQAQSLHPTHKVNPNKTLSNEWKQKLYNDTEQKVYKGEELYTIGMPVGGICAGQLYVRGDGTLANWWIANNAHNTGYGIAHLLNFDTKMGPWKVCYQKFKPMSYIEQGVDLIVEQGGKKIKKELSEKDFKNIEFIGEYPVAEVKYKDAKMPVKIDAEFFSPFIPLNARDSANPMTVMRYKVKNSSNKDAKVTLRSRLQNPVFLELRDEVSAQSRNKIVKNGDNTSLFCDVIEKKVPRKKPVVFDSFDNFDNWTVKGEAFGTPSSGQIGRQSSISGNDESFVNSFHGEDKTVGEMSSKPFKIKKDYIHFLVGGGAHKNTALQLIVDDKVVRTASGKNREQLEPNDWKVSELKGKTAQFRIVDNNSGGWGHILVDEIKFADYPVMKPFDKNHSYYGNVAMTVLDGGKGYVGQNGGVAKLGDKLTGFVEKTVKVAAGKTKEVTFVLSWYFPNRKTDPGRGTWDWSAIIPVEGEEVGQMYDNWYDSSLDVVNYFDKNQERLINDTFKFHESYYRDSNLPYWLNQRIMMTASILASETCQWWKNGRFWAFEGVGSCHGTCTHVWNYEHMMARLFPELERKLREEQDFGVAFNANGAVNTRGVNGGCHFDGHCGAILKAYREHLMSKDVAFLKRNWSKIKKAMLFMIGQDGNDNGLIEGNQPNTYDISFFGANTYVGSLYLAALKASGEMATLMGDSEFSTRCAKIAKNGSKNSVEKLWNGSYFIQDVDRKKHSHWQYAKGCLADQLFGQTWAHQLNLGHIYPVDKVEKTLDSIFKYNFTFDVAEQNKTHHPERTYADYGEAGLFICTWPFTEHHGEIGVRYRNEVWTGIEYQVASNMINEGKIDEGMTLLRAIHDRYDGTTNNPWNEIECGDHYARAMASYGALIALQGYHYDGPRGYLKFAPKLQKENLKTFFTSAEGWSNYSQKIGNDKMVAELSPKYGKLSLKTIELSAPFKVSKASVKNGKLAKFTQNGGKIVVTLAEKLNLKKGDSLTILLKK